ncbi:hypothetical protein [Clostridium luticellarii]|uniref:Methyltransferase n=1 Tax=Clostridium luticellarii TaxID=1691940 RepID=A0A2T0BNN7_9CLOT|nr:hypothetical protein [Clostridium luticellarii]PRR85508.1 hypothetical protein CLLU_14290 [Clostridium luticellarii]
MSKWNYGDAYLKYPLSQAPYIFNNGSIVQVHDIFNPLPEFMKKADLIFVDPPWNRGNINTFYMKAEKEERIDNFSDFYIRLFKCIRKIKAKTCYIEIGKEFLADFIIEAKKIYKYVTFYNSSYYHSKDKICYVIRGSRKFKKPKLDYMDEEDIIEWVCTNEDYDIIGDLCMGRGLVGLNAYKNGKKFVGTELNHKRLSVLIERIEKYKEGQGNVK